MDIEGPIPWLVVFLPTLISLPLLVIGTIITTALTFHSEKIIFYSVAIFIIPFILPLILFFLLLVSNQIFILFS